MRTTVNLEYDVLTAARKLAAARSVPLGKALSDLARRGLEAPAPARRTSGFPVFEVPRGARRITLEDVKRDEDEG